MKKIFLVLLCLCMVGCTQEKDDETEKKETKTEEQKELNSKEFEMNDDLVRVQNQMFIITNSNGELFGMVNKNGKKVLPIEYDEIKFPENLNCDFVIAKKEGKYGIVDSDGSVIQPFEYDKMDGYRGTSNYALANKDKHSFVLDQDGKVSKELKNEYDLIFADNFLVSGNQYCGYLNSTSRSDTSIVLNANKIYDLEEKEIYSFENFIMIDFGSDYFAISNKGVQNSDQWIIFDKKGNGKIAIPYSNNMDLFPTNYLGGSYIKIWNDGPKLLDIEKEKVTEDTYKELKLLSNKAFAIINDTLCLIDDKGQIVKKIDNDPSNYIIREGLEAYIKKTDNTYRIYDLDGKDIMDERYLEVLTINHNSNYLIVKNLDGLYGLINIKGDIVIPYGDIDTDKNSEINNYKGEPIVKCISDSNGKDLYFVLKTNDNIQKLIKVS